MSENSPTLVLPPNIQNCCEIAKITIESEDITSFCGIFHVMGIFSHFGLSSPQLFDSLFDNGIYS